MNQLHLSNSINYFLALAESYQCQYLALEYGTSEWQDARDIYVNLSNAAAQLMGERLNPFI